MGAILADILQIAIRIYSLRSTMVSSRIGSNPNVPFQNLSTDDLQHLSTRDMMQLPIHDFVIGNVVIHGREKGMRPELIFWIARNPNDPYAKQLIDENPDDLERIRELGAKIQPIKKDIYSQTPALKAALAEYGGCTEDEISKVDSRKIERNKYLPKQSKQLMYEDLQAIANRDTFMLPGSAYADLNYTDTTLSRIINNAQLTQNVGLLEKILSAEVEVPELTNAYEVLGGPLHGEKDEEALYRAQLGISAGYVLRSKLQMEGDGSEADQSVIMTVVPTYGLDWETSERLGYVTTSPGLMSHSNLISRVVESDGKPRLSAILIRKIDGRFRIFQKYIVRPHTTGKFSLLNAIRWGLKPAKDTPGTSGLSTAECLSPLPLNVLEGTEYCKVVVVSDIYPVTMISVDAMVNETDPQLKRSIEGSISKDIVKAAGDDLRKKCKKIPKTKHPAHGQLKQRCPLGKVVFTESCDMIKKNGITRLILHASILDMNRMEVLRKYPNSGIDALVQKSYDSIFVSILNHNLKVETTEEDNLHSPLEPLIASEDNKVFSILVPALGINCGCDEATSLASFVRAMKKHGQALKNQGVTVVFGCRTKDEAIKAKSSIQALED